MSEATRRGPEGLAFYTPPSPLVPGPAGDVIWARLLNGAAALAGAAETFLLLYHSVTVAGRDIAVSGTVSIPPGEPPAGGWPVLSWAHGTTGVAAMCAPSRDAAGHPSHTYLRLVDAMLAEWVRRGYVVTKTDYEGLGTPGPHPYLVGTSEARGTIDIVTAARQLHPGIGRRWAAMGHSQGGHAVLFVSALAGAWAPDLELVGVVAMAPAGGAATMISRLSDHRAPPSGLALLPLVLAGAAAGSSVSLRELLTPAALRLLGEAQTHGIDDLHGPGSWASLVPDEVFRPDADVSALVNVLAANEAGKLRLRAPALVVQGGADPMVSRSGTDDLVIRLRAGGGMVDYEVHEDTGHYDLIAAAHDDNVRWIDAKTPRAHCAPSRTERNCDVSQP